MNYEARISIDAPAATVWAVLADVEHWADWTRSVRSIELLDDEFAVGRRVRIRQPRFPRVIWTVTDVQAGRSFSWRSKSVGATGTTTKIDWLRRERSWTGSNASLTL